MTKHSSFLEYTEKQNMISKPAPIMVAAKINDKNITTNDLLHMNSGLNRRITVRFDATTMLFQSGNMGRIQLEDGFAPNRNYSSGTTNLLSIF
jgi:CubicO group peptidase (beta-lactamase class C family)